MFCDRPCTGSLIFHCQHLCMMSQDLVCWNCCPPLVLRLFLLLANVKYIFVLNLLSQPLGSTSEQTTNIQKKKNPELSLSFWYGVSETRTQTGEWCESKDHRSLPTQLAKHEHLPCAVLSFFEKYWVEEGETMKINQSKCLCKVSACYSVWLSGVLFLDPSMPRHTPIIVNAGRKGKWR